MRTLAVLLLLLDIAIVGGGFYLQSRNPAAFARLETDFIALLLPPPPPDASPTDSGPAPTGPSPLIKHLAAPALRAVDKQAAAISNVENTPAAPPATAPAPLPAQTAAKSIPPPTPPAAALAASAAPAPPPSLATWQPPATMPAQPNWTWTTTDGHTYKNVKVLSVDPENVSILDEDGGATVAIATLPADVQKQLNYDPKFAANWTVGRLVSGNLFTLKAGNQQPVDDATLRPLKYFAIYYSAQWCPPCHHFTPELVKFYNDFKPAHPDFDLIFVSEDYNAGSMLDYMKEMSMPWPAVNFNILHSQGERVFKGPGIEGFANNGIPDLVLVDATGKVLSDSFDGDTYLGPDHVIADIQKMVQ